MLRKDKFSDKADILIESIPYFLRFRGKIFVFKIGGKILDVQEVFDSVADDIVLLSLVGIKPVLVHGGGKEINTFLDRLGIKYEFHEGIRRTDDNIMEIVEMVLDGKIKGRLVSSICKKGGKAMGISGRDLFSIISERTEGRVGRVKHVRADGIKKLLDLGFIPVFSPITVLDDGTSMNTNADEVACELSISLGAEKLVILTDEQGILDRNGNLIKSISEREAEMMISDGSISGGMIPKVRLAIRAIKNGVKKVHIITGLLKHSVLIEIFTDEGIGTEIRAE